MSGSPAKTPVIALEEHYWDKELVSHLTGAEGSRSPDMLERLYDLGAIRLREMDEAGIDIQFLSHGAPSGQKLAEDVAAGLVQRVNDRLAAAVSQNPSRLLGFAALPTIVPEAAADELERCVTQHKFKGAMVHGLTNGLFLDDKRFWPIFARAEKLDVPIYLHPSFPDPRVVEVYYKDYVQAYPQVIRAAWGYTVEAATQAIRLVLSGVFKEYPKLKFILGHMGETLPFLLWRIDQALSRPGQESLSFRQTFCEHFWITTSGNFSTPALICSMQEVGVDHIMFAVDWPFVANPPAMKWMNELQISQADKNKIFGENARKLFRL